MVDSRDGVKKKNEKATNTEIISLIGQEWRALSDSEKQRFEQGAVADKVRTATVTRDSQLATPAASANGRFTLSRRLPPGSPHGVKLPLLAELVSVKMLVSGQDAGVSQDAGDW
jgi:hypothetical protein